MVNVLLAFVTGLTTGGLSCLAVQGGLLASSLANQIEGSPVVSGAKKKKGAQQQPSLKGKQLALPILAFLAAKLVAYTLLGFLLGFAGSMFQLSPLARAALQIGIGIFMVGSALRMFNVHPIFRYFVFEPPAPIRRFIRRKSKSNGDGLAAPVFLGLLTVLIPCGITQAMMAVALSTADPIQGAALMFAFTLGASPLFFAVAYFATQLGSKLEKHFVRFVALVLLVLGLFSVDTGLALAGSPVSVTRVMANLNRGNGPSSQVAAPVGEGRGLQTFDPAGPAQEAEGEPAFAEDENVVTVKVENYGYNPDVVYAKAGVPVKLRLVSQNVYSCSLAFAIPSLNVFLSLEPTGEAFVEIPPQEKGTKMPFSCSMGMFVGDIVFE